MKLHLLKKKKINFRKYLINNSPLNLSQITKLSYDLQAGDYIKNFTKTLKNKKLNQIHNKNVNNFFKYIKDENIKTFLDFGTGEANRLIEILKYNKNIKKLFGCDISFNRLSVGYDYLNKELNNNDLSKISLFCNEDFILPFKKNSIDIISTIGCLENMSNNKMNKIIIELLRVVKKKLILIEPRNKNITKKEFKRMKKLKLNYNLNNILIKNKLNFIEDEWYKYYQNKTPYSMRIISKSLKKPINNYKFYLNKENYPLIKRNNFYYSQTGKIIPIINNISIFRSLDGLNYIE